MRVFHEYKYRSWCPTVNIEKLWALAGEETYKNAKKDTSKAVVIDVMNDGYAKVLGRGTLPKLPVVVRARYFSKKAERKIRAAGGVCELRA